MTESKDDWQTQCLEEAHAAHNVSDAVTSLLKEKLSGVARERPLRPPELSELAKDLIEALQKPSTTEPEA